MASSTSGLLSGINIGSELGQTEGCSIFRIEDQVILVLVADTMLLDAFEEDDELPDIIMIIGSMMAFVLRKEESLLEKKRD